MPDIMKFEFARYCDGDLIEREVARVWYIHLRVIHSKLNAYSAIVAEGPD